MFYLLMSVVCPSTRLFEKDFGGDSDHDLDPGFSQEFFKGFSMKFLVAISREIFMLYIGKNGFVPVRQLYNVTYSTLVQLNMKKRQRYRRLGHTPKNNRLDFGFLDPVLLLLLLQA